jgi:hypothetical protein
MDLLMTLILIALFYATVGLISFCRFLQDLK